MDVEQLLRQEFAARTAAPPNPVDLADRAILRATGVRTRRAMVVATAAVVVAVAALAVGLIGAPEPTAPDGAPDEVAAALSELPVGAPPRLAVFGPRTLKLATGVEIPVSGTDGLGVRRVAGGWVVLTPRGREGDSLRVVRDDGAEALALYRVSSWAASRDGSRVAVHTKGDNRFAVFELPSGRSVASTAVPAESSAARIRWWTGSLVVLRWPTPGTSRGTTDVWDPAKGDYRPAPWSAHEVFGPAAEPGQLLAFERATVAPDVCVIRVDPAAGFAVTARACQVGLRSDEPWPMGFVSPDGSRLLVYQHPPARLHQVLDLRTMANVPQPTTLPLPPDLDVSQTWWEDTTTILLRVHPKGEPLIWGGPMHLVRCRVDGSPCELAPAPRVDGADPLGLADG